MAAKSNLALKSFRADSFAGIDKSSPLVLVFEDGKLVTKFTGNQGVGKTSALNALMYTMAQNIMVDPVNIADQTTKTELNFVGKDGGSYRIRGQRTRLIIEQEVKGRWVEEKTPQALIRKLVGPVGQDPMVLKQLDGLKQISWIEAFFNLDDEAKKLKEDLAKNLKSAMDDRKAANKRIKSADVRLAAEPLFSKYEESLKLYSQPAEDVKALEDDCQAKDLKKSEYEKAKTKFDDIDTTITGYEEQIGEYQQKIDDLREKVNAERERKTIGSKWLEDNKSVYEDRDIAWKALQAANEKAVKRAEFMGVKALFEAKQTDETEAQTLTFKIDQYRKTQKKFVQEITPAVEGLEVCVPYEIDPVEEYAAAKYAYPEFTEEQLQEYVKGLKGEDRTGLYYNKKSLLQLSESELWECYLKFCKELGVNIVMIENLTSLGSEAIAVLNQIAADGVYIFASEMNRNEDAIRISFTDKID